MEPDTIPAGRPSTGPCPVRLVIPGCCLLHVDAVMLIVDERVPRQVREQIGPMLGEGHRPECVTAAATYATAWHATHAPRFYLNEWIKGEDGP